MLSIAFGVSPTASAEQQVRFGDTPAAKAFLAKDYATALEQFRKLRETNPNNTLILRYLAITLDRLGRHEEAIEVFREALAIAPNSPALHYHIGVSYYNARRGKAALDAFERVLELALESRYSDSAERHIDAISQQRAQSRKAGGPQAFDVYLQAGVQYDDNVLAADESETALDDNRIFGYLYLAYHLNRSPRWLVTLAANGYGVEHDDDRFESFETSQYGSDVSVQRTGTLGNAPFVSSAKLNFSESRLPDSGKYSRSRSLMLGLRVDLSRSTSTQGYYRFTDDDFTDDGFDPAFSSRDAGVQEIGLRQIWYFAERRGQVSAALEYEHNDADGVNFEMEGYNARVETVFPLPWELQAELTVAYGENDYDKFAGPVRRETERTRYSAGLSRWLGGHFQLRLEYNYVDEDSTIDSLSYDREVLGASVSYAY